MDNASLVDALDIVTVPSNAAVDPMGHNSCTGHPTTHATVTCTGTVTRL